MKILEVTKPMAQKYLERRVVHFLSFYTINKKQFSSLPCLPVPPLLNTLKKLLTSSKPFVNSNEYCWSEKMINNFGQPGGEGEYLQSLLLERAEKMDNWLQDWWQSQTLLNNRSPLIQSNIGLSYPVCDFESVEDFLDCASKIAAGALQFKKLIDEDKVFRECIGDDPLDMRQYKKMFGTCRIPYDNWDKLQYNSKSDHIIVAYKNNFYKVTVRENLSWLNHSAIFQQFKEILRDDSEGPRIGILTSDCRDSWLQTYMELRSNHWNYASIKAIEDSLFIVCLDDSLPKKHTSMGSGVANFIHGNGPCYNTGNRWFDKTLQFIVGRNGETGVNFEQSPVEVQVILIMMNFICAYMETARDSCIISQCSPEKLFFEIDNNMQWRIFDAEKRVERLINDLDIYCFKFEMFGNSFLNCIKIPPDSFVQMAIQLAYYRLHQIITPQFQIATLRKFKDGRSGFIRSCSEETVRFVCAMDSPLLSTQSKANSLYNAIKIHQELANEAIDGYGIDTHLFGLRMVACENCRPEPDIFRTPSFFKSSIQNLITCQVVSKFDGFAASGPPSPTAYKCDYKLGENYISFSITTYKSNGSTNAFLFGQSLTCSMRDMRDIIKEAPCKI